MILDAGMLYNLKFNICQIGYIISVSSASV